MRTPRTFRLQDLGCKVNQYETQLFREGLLGLGLSEASEAEAADVCVVNSCSVTLSGGAASRSVVRRLIRENPDAAVLVTGCYAESDREVCDAIEGVTRSFGNKEKDKLVGFVARELLQMEGELPDLPNGISHFMGHTRAFVKIQDGCRDNCTFCIIPSLRGELKSRTIADVVTEVERLVASGYREVVFTGVHLGYYGWKMEGSHGLCDLLEAMRGIDGLERVKLSSIEVHEIDDRMLEIFFSDPRFVPHFHLPLQSGSDGTLQRMRRKYNIKRFREAVRAIRERCSDAAITTDVIVGFPGETVEEFEESLGFAREMRFAKMHIFPYSIREGTPAATAPNHVHSQEKKERAQAFAQLDDELAEAFRCQFIGRTEAVLIEERRRSESGRLTGLTDRFVRVEVDGPDDWMGQIVDLQLVASDEGVLVARPFEGSPTGPTLLST